MSRPGLLALVVFGLALTLYITSLAPDVLWGDLAEFQADAADLQLEFGLRAYPLYRLLTYTASALPVGNLAYRVNLFSAICAAAAVAVLFLAGTRMRWKTSACFVAAGALAVAHEFWSQAVLAEVYSLNALLLASLALLLLDERRLTVSRILLTGVVLAAGCLHHQTILFVYPACFIVLLIRRHEAFATKRLTIATFVSLVCATAPALLLFLGSGSASDAALANSLSGGGRSLLSRLSYVGRLLVLDFPSPALPLILLGAWISLRNIRRPAHAFLLSSAGGFLLLPLFLRWFGDQHVFLLPAFLFLSLLAGVGANRVPWRGVLRAAMVASVLLMPPAAYLGVTSWLTRPDAPNPFKANREYAKCFFWPPKRGYRHPREFTEEVLAGLPSNANLICTWGEGKTALYLQKVEGFRPDVSVRLIHTGRDFKRAVVESKFPLWVTRYPYFADHQRAYSLPPGYRYAHHEPGQTLLRVHKE